MTNDPSNKSDKEKFWDENSLDKMRKEGIDISGMLLRTCNLCGLDVPVGCKHICKP